MWKIGSILLAFFAGTAVSSDTLAQPVPPGCKHESGVVRQGQNLNGPFLILSLKPAGAPAPPGNTQVVWGPDSTWLSVDDFKPPFFLKQGEFLRGQNPQIGSGAVYFGCRM